MQIIGSDIRLRESMDRFLEETGVPPAVITVSEEVWQQTHRNFRSYSKDRYSQLFEDNTHLLIVYTVPESSRGSLSPGDWEFECITGDLAEPSINPPLADRFARKIYDLLCEEDGPGQAFCEAFDWLIEERSHILKLNQEEILLFLSRSPIAFAPYLIDLYMRLKRYRYRTAMLDTPPEPDPEHPRRKIRRI